MKYCVITVVESVSVTSMPVNEFVLYRCAHNPSCRQVLIVCSDSIPSDVSFPSEVDVKLVGRNVLRMRSTLKKIIDDCKNNKEGVVVHLHAPRASLLYFVGTMFLHLRKKTIFSVHSTYNGRNLKYRMTSFICALLSNYVVCVSNAAFKGYSTIIKKIKGNHILAIPNGVDIQRIENTISAQSHNDTVEVRRMVCVGRLIPIKNQKFLINLLPSLEGVELILVGIGGELESLKKFAQEKGVLDRVKFMGLIPREGVYEILNRCDIYVSASIVEGMPVSVLEAMAIGLFPVVSNVPAHQEIAGTCTIVKALPLSKPMWVDTIKEYLRKSSENRKNVSEFLKLKTKENFSLEKMHQSYNNIYDLLATQ